MGDSWGNEGRLVPSDFVSGGGKIWHQSKGFFFILGRKCPTLPKMNSSRDVSKQYNKNLSDSNVILSRNHLVRKRTRPIWLNG